MKNILWLSLLTSFIFGCGGSKVSTSGLAAHVTRGAENQPSIKITGHVAASRSLEADLLLFEEQGFATAQDRFLQMDLLRRVSRGKLSELIGSEESFEKDSMILGLGVVIAAENSSEKIKNNYPEIYELLIAYSKGVNRFIDSISSAQPELLRQYKVITGSANYQPAHWEPLDSVAIMDSFAFYLSTGFKEKLAWGTIAKIIMVSEMNNQNAVKTDAKEGAGESQQGYTLSNINDLLDLRPIEDDVIVDEKDRYHKASPGPVQITSNKAKAKSSLTSDQKKIVKAFLKSKYECRDLGFPIPECNRNSGFGSNNWAVSSKFSGGATYVANDPHLPLSFPMTFYEVALDSKSAGGSIQVRGVVPPGIPGVLIGHNDNIAWALTNLGADVDDLYVEQLDETRTRIVKPSTPLRIIKRTVRVRNEKKDRVVELKYTDSHGPLVSDHIPELKEAVKVVEKIGAMGKHVDLAYKWTGHPGTTEVVGVLSLNRAKNYDEFKSAVQHIQTGAQNVVFADKNGAIGYYGHGDFPIRKYVTRRTSASPNGGDDNMDSSIVVEEPKSSVVDENLFLSVDEDEERFRPPPYVFVEALPGETREWEDTYRTKMPEIFRRDGYIVTANNDPLGQSLEKDLSGYDDYFGYGFSDGVRAHRIRELIEQRKKNSGVLTSDDMSAIQLDVKDGLAARFIELFEKNGAMDHVSTRAKKFAAQMIEWKNKGCFAYKDLKEPVDFYEWLKAVRAEVFKYPYPEVEKSKSVDKDKTLPVDEKTQERTPSSQWKSAIDFVSHSSPVVKTLYHRLSDGLSEEPGSVKYNYVIRLIDKAVEEGQKNQRKKWGSNRDADIVTGPRWGQLNRLVFYNALEGIVPQRCAVAWERNGSWETVNVAGPGFGPNFRLVMTLKPNEPIEAKISVPGGNYDCAKNQDAFNRELLNWLQGNQRPLISF